jgi:hypothetical protein
VHVQSRPGIIASILHEWDSIILLTGVGERVDVGTPTPIHLIHGTRVSLVVSPRTHMSFASKLEYSNNLALWEVVL